MSESIYRMQHLIMHGIHAISWELIHTSEDSTDRISTWKICAMVHGIKLFTQINRFTKEPFEDKVVVHNKLDVLM